MYKNTKLAVSKSKAAYALANIHEKHGAFDEAIKWYEEASNYSSTFYGQLASYFNLNESIKIDTAIISTENAKKISYLIYYLYKNGNKHVLHDIVNHINTVQFNVGELNYIADFLIQKKLEPIAVELSKVSANKGFKLVERGYPRNLSIEGNMLPHAIYYSIIRQESKFDKAAISPVGAKGLMQLMPQTAHNIAATLGLPKSAYEYDHIANIKKGVAYLDQLYVQYQNLILAVASYNAGPSNVNKWLEAFGDIRLMPTIQERIKWIESIPYVESRDYIKKILGNAVIYSKMLNEDTLTVVDFLML